MASQSIEIRIPIAKSVRPKLPMPDSPGDVDEVNQVFLDDAGVVFYRLDEQPCA